MNIINNKLKHYVAVFICSMIFQLNLYSQTDNDELFARRILDDFSHGDSLIYSKWFPNKNFINCIVGVVKTDSCRNHLRNTFLNKETDWIKEYHTSLNESVKNLRVKGLKLGVNWNYVIFQKVDIKPYTDLGCLTSRNKVIITFLSNDQWYLLKLSEVTVCNGMYTIANEPNIEKIQKKEVELNLNKPRLKRFKLGDEVYDGLVFWIDNSGEHGLVVDRNELGEFTWDEAMKAAQKKGKDWRLPTQEECRKLHENKNIVPSIEYSSYWTSTLFNDKEAILFYFSEGFGENFYKHLTYKARAVRSF
jgi:hypothetical protein